MSDAVQADNDDQIGFAIADLGARLKQIRVMRKLSLVELSAKSTVSVAMLSHIERGRVAPSLNTLQRISHALEVPLSDIFGAMEREQVGGDHMVVRSTNRIRIDVGIPGVYKELLSPAHPSNIEVLMLVLAPGSSSGDKPWQGDSEKAGLILSGAMELVVDGSPLRLNAGDSFQFDGALPHTFRNVSESETRLVWIIHTDTKVE